MSMTLKSVDTFRGNIFNLSLAIRPLIILREITMAYVVTQACIGNKHTDCVDVCPVEAFREGPDMLFIDPEACIECNACLTECPERAIFPQSAVPENMQHFIQLNADNAVTHPVIRESIKRDKTASPMAAFTGRFAVIGSGPSGFYASEELLKKMPSAKVDMFERLPTPFGLVRYGVAPDHPRIKSVTSGFERIAQHKHFRFFGNVQIGQDLSRQDLLKHYDGVIYATGGSRSRELNIPGAQQTNIFGSSTFVGWYNGHPDQRHLVVDFSHKTAVIIGIGNVALDIARMLILPSAQLDRTDMSDHALMQLNFSAVTEVCLMARRGPAQAAFTPKELEQLMSIDGLELIVDPADLELDAKTLEQLSLPEFSEAQQNIKLLRKIALRPRAPSMSGRKRIRFLFWHSPASIAPDQNGMKSIKATPTNTNNTTLDVLDIEAGLIIHAIGYQGDAINQVPFDASKGVINNQNGKVHNGDESCTKEYTAGWIKRGASGVIGSNKQCASDTVAQLFNDLSPDTQPLQQSDIQSLLIERAVSFLSFADWQLLDEYEQQQGKILGRPRRKVTDVNKMLQVIQRAHEQQKAEGDAQAKQPIKTHLRSCTLCEAMCGVKIKFQGEKILAIEGDAEDPHSGGHICPKGYSLQDLHNDPDRLKTPLQKVDGQWLPIDWESALDIVSERLVEIQVKHGNDAVGAYWGNPSSHNFGLLMATGKFRKALGSRNLFTAASLDQLPHQLMSYLMFGHGQVFTIPDIDHTDYMLMLGANPAASNGSLMSSGDVLKRLEGIEARGGKWVLVDPRKTESSLYASEHQFIRPGTDPLFVAGLIQHIIQNELYNPDHLLPMMDGFEQLLTMFDDFDLIDISEQCGIPISKIQQIATEFAAAESAICYGRMGVSTQNFSTLNHWLMNVLNILTGNLDRRGGMMFTNPAVDFSLKANTAGSYEEYHSRVRGLPEFNREFPASILAEEILTPGPGQIKAFVCIAGNPALSTPNSRQVDEALEQLDFMVSLDFYLNETSRHADIILPPTGPLEHEQFDLVFNLLAVRNVAKFAEPLFEHNEDTRSDWDILNGLLERINILKGVKPKKNAAPELSLEQMLDFGLKGGPYGKAYQQHQGEQVISHPHGLSLKELKKYPHGLDLGPLQPRLPNHLFTHNQKIQLLPQQVLSDFKTMQTHFTALPESNSFMLIGRRDLRTNNSWMHNSQRLVKGKDRCALFINPQDAHRLGLSNQCKANVSSRVGELVVDVKISNDIMPGVVSLPHGWGHDREGIRLRVAQSNPGLSANDLTDDQEVDTLSGNAIFNAVAVTISAL